MKNNLTNIKYIELRLLMYIDCAIKYEKINNILNFLKTHGFVVNLTIVHPNVEAESFDEDEDVMSLTIDIPRETLRFKFWNGVSVIWLFHTSDLLDFINMSREGFLDIYDKYEPVTEVLFDFKRRWATSIYDISYEYPSDSDVEIIYNIIFTQEVKDTNFDSKILEKINKEIIMLGKDITDKLNFEIKHSFQLVGCSSCEQSKKEREKNEINKKNDR